MIRVLDETRSVDFYRQAFGLEIAERLDFETFTLVYMSNAESEFELKQLRGDMETARKTESDLRNAISELEGRSSSANQRLKTENTQLAGELERAQEERDRHARDLGKMKREAEESWAAERVENALLRERINDVAAEVARLATALEGPDSTINAILAAETTHDRTATSAHAEGELAGPSNGNLADRIRALQTQASRVALEDEPQTRN